MGQLPYKGGDRWAALPGPIPGGLLSPAASAPLAQAVSFDQPVSGLLIDDWSEMVPKAHEITGLTFHFDQPKAYAPQAMLLAVAPDDRPVWDLDILATTLLETMNLVRTRALLCDGHLEVTWGEGTLPRGAQAASDSEGSWNWVTHDPTPLSRGPVHTSPVMAGEHKHYFSGASETLKVAVGDSSLCLCLPGSRQSANGSHAGME